MHRSWWLLRTSHHVWKCAAIESRIPYHNLNKLIGLSSINPRTNMPAEKRKAPSNKMGNAKKQKLQVAKEGMGESEEVNEHQNQDLKFNKKRMRFLSQTEKMKQGSEGVVYWMNRDHRVQDNWALILAQQLALEGKVPLHICVCLVLPQNSKLATLRHVGFMLRGLEENAKECRALDIQFHLLQGSAGEVLPGFVADWNLGAVVTDFSPLREPLRWLEDVKKGIPLDIPFIQVDAHNVVPCWVASDKQEYAARTIRTKINKLLPEFLTEMPTVGKHPHPAAQTAKPVDWAGLMSSLELDRTVEEVGWARPGTAAGLAMLESFIDQRLKNFATLRNNPNSSALSQLSPWIRFGHLSAQRVVLRVKSCEKKARESVPTFIEELVVRRELTDNFCFYNSNYDSVKGASDWAQKTLKDHAKDPRPYVYSQEQLEKAQTHDKLWNAAQYQMVTEGKMHGFMRMYWAKKILEWTSSPEEALSIAIYLNDRYELDGQDPNGFVGKVQEGASYHLTPISCSVGLPTFVWPVTPLFFFYQLNISRNGYIE
uniref:Deoxyribodipyrimidine photo-lyase n=1 Tax=Esox lucius TaxID=8010 RepID=A0AAY5LD13_ESOLU